MPPCDKDHALCPDPEVHGAMRRIKRKMVSDDIEKEGVV